MKSDLKNGNKERDKKNDDLKKYGDVEMKKRDKLILAGFVAGCLLLTGLYSTVVFWLSEIAEKTKIIGTFVSLALIFLAIYIVWRSK